MSLPHPCISSWCVLEEIEESTKCIADKEKGGIKKGVGFVYVDNE